MEGEAFVNEWTAVKQERIGNLTSVEAKSGGTGASYVPIFQGVYARGAA